MRILSLPVNFVKISIRSTRTPLLAFAVVSVMAIILASSIFAVKRSSVIGINSTEKTRQGCCSDQPAILRRMVGTYYTTEDGFQSTLILNNKGPNQIIVTPILHSQNGQSYTASPVAVVGQSSLEVDLNLLASIAGPQFRSGSFEFTYEGRLLEVGGGLRIINPEKSLIFDEQLLEPGMKFPSSRLEAVYAVPFEDSQVNIIVTNITAEPIFVNGDAIFAGANGHHPIQIKLEPHQTLDVKMPHGLIKKASAGAVSLNHNGGKGALLAKIHLQAIDRGYSESVNFINPDGKTNERHGAGLRLGSVNNDPLRTLIAVRNIGDSSTTVTATVPYSKDSGKIGTIVLPEVSLDSGEIRLMETSNPQLRQIDFATAGLEIKYTGEPGSVIATALSVSQSGNHVFAVPMKDPKGGLSSTGGYPWFIKESSSTVVFIKNVTSDSQEFLLNIIYPGGRWGKNRTIAPNQTIQIDIREVRNSQEKGVEGNVIPIDATSGHVSWAYRGKQNKVLIGRAQSVDFSNGLASTYECQCSCGNIYRVSRLVPFNSTIQFPGSKQLEPQSAYYDCFGNPTDFFPASPMNSIFWSSDNTNAASVSNGHVTGNGSGSATIYASWNEYYSECFILPGELNCYTSCMDRTGSASTYASVTVQCVYPTGETFASTGWSAEVPTAQKWMMTLTPTTTNFAGRFVFETDPGGGIDGCHFPGSEIDPEPSCCDNAIPSTWPVESGNRWGPDVVGWLPSAVEYYQLERLTRGLPLPCRATWPQRMRMHCGTLGASSNYVDNILFAEIDVTTVSSGRNGRFEQREWPVP